MRCFFQQAGYLLLSGEEDWRFKEPRKYLGFTETREVLSLIERRGTYTNVGEYEGLLPNKFFKQHQFLDSTLVMKLTLWIFSFSAECNCRKRQNA